MVAAALAWFAWKWWPNDEQAIRKLLNNLARAASIEPSESGLTRLAYGERLASFFTTNATLNLGGMGGDLGSVHGRTELAQAALGIRSSLREADFKITDAIINFPAEEGVANGYVVIAGHIRGSGTVQPDRERFGQAFRMSFRKQQARWRIEDVTAEKGLQ